MISLGRGGFIIKLPQMAKGEFYSLLGLIKSIPGRKYDRDTGSWYIPEGSYRFMLEKVGKRLELAPDARRRIDQMAERERELLGLSLSRGWEGKRGRIDLLPHQLPAVEYLIRTRRCILGDQMGMGKTVVSLAAVEELGGYPLLVVCPASLKINWAREISRFLGKEAEVLSGLDADVGDSEIYIANYDILGRSGSLSGTGRALLSKAPKTVICDESHYIKNKKTNRYKAVKELSSSSENVFLLSGTAIVNRPKDLIPQLEVIGKLEDFGGFFGFAGRYCGLRKGKFGYEYDGAFRLDELNERLRSRCYIRRNKDEVLSLPEKARQNIYLPLQNEEEYRRAERDIIDWVYEEAKRRIKKEGGDLRSAALAAMRAKGAEHLVRMAKLTGLAAEGKKEHIREWAANFIEEEPLVLFVIHRDIMSYMRESFPDAAYITSDLSPQERMEMADRFQRGEHDLLICALGMSASSSPAGLGLNLTRASNVAFAELGFSPALHEQAEDRCHRIGQERRVNAYYLVAEDSIDERILSILDGKREIFRKSLEDDPTEFAAELAASLLGNENPS